MKIRPFQPGDLQKLYEIDQACFPPGVSYPKRVLTHFISRRGSQTWVAEADNKIVGFLIVEREIHSVGHIVTIDVVEGWRRRSVGRALLETAEAWAKDQGLRKLYLETAEDNLPAQRFYEAHQYVGIGKVDAYYADGKAAWVYAKAIGS